MIDIVKGDITELNVDCIVNAANSHLMRGGGVCGAIFRKAGNDLDRACAELDGCETGCAKMTSSFEMKNCKWICHAVGPIYSGSSEDEKLLKKCYWNSLILAKAYGCDSIAFPCISTGIYGYPLEDACKVAWNTVNEWETRFGDLKIVLCCFDDDSFEIYKNLEKEKKNG